MPGAGENAAFDATIERAAILSEMSSVSRQPHIQDHRRGRTGKIQSAAI
jgi:hypothetical protein